MMHTFLRPIIVCSFLCMLLSACQHSPRKHYFLLNAPAVPLANLQQNSSDNITQVIGIGPIEIADYLNRSAIVYVQTDNALIVSDNEYWGEPLDKGIARVISDTLTQRNSTRSFVNYPWRSNDKPHYSLRVDINSLNCSNTEASINATWELIDNTTKTNIQRRNFIRSTPATTGTKALVQAYSKLLTELASEMDDALSKADK